MCVRHSDGRRAYYLAALVDRGGAAGVATGEGAEVDHYPVFKQKRVAIPARGARFADYLAARVDAGGSAEVAAGESAEVEHCPVLKQKSMSRSYADHLAVGVDAGGDS